MVSLPRPKIFKKRQNKQQSKKPSAIGRLCTFIASIFLSSKPNEDSTPKKSSKNRFLARLKKGQNQVRPTECYPSESLKDVSVDGGGSSVPHTEVTTIVNATNDSPLNPAHEPGPVKPNHILSENAQPAFLPSNEDLLTVSPSSTEDFSGPGNLNSSKNNLLKQEDKENDDTKEDYPGSETAETLDDPVTASPISDNNTLDGDSSKIYTLTHTNEGSQMPVMKSCVPIVKKPKRLKPIALASPPSVNQPLTPLPQIQMMNGSQLPLTKTSVPLKPKKVKKKEQVEESNQDVHSPLPTTPTAVIDNRFVASIGRKEVKNNTSHVDKMVDPALNLPESSLPDINQSLAPLPQIQTVSGSQLPLLKTSIPLKPKKKKQAQNIEKSNEDRINTSLPPTTPAAVIDSRFVASIGRKQDQKNISHVEEMVDSALDLPESQSVDVKDENSGFEGLFEVLNLATGVLPHQPNEHTDSGIKIDTEKANGNPLKCKLPPLNSSAPLVSPKTIPAIQSDFPEFPLTVQSVESFSPPAMVDENVCDIDVTSRKLVSSAIDNAILKLFNDSDIQLSNPF
ncbi:uncharacterized protein [Clytia hemisphaerica]|uniref:uncharacterized protein n=1 Tax=Clytia hemisphaerica TaxID=252671 RepID=UPI0034D6ACFB